MDKQPEKIRIVTKVPLSSLGTEVWIGDVRMRHVRNVTFTHPAGEVPLVVIEIIPKDGVEIEGVAEIERIEFDPRAELDPDKREA